MEDLEMAIEKADAAVRRTPIDHPDLGACLNNLGIKLVRRYERIEPMADLETAIDKAEEVVRRTPIDHPDLAGWLNNLARRQMLAPGPVQTENALSSFLRAWHCHSGIPSLRLMSAVAAVDLLITKMSWNEAADLAIEAINLLPRMNKRVLSQDDQQHILSRFTGLAAKTCSSLLESGRPVEASVEILEQDRGAVLGLMIDDRRDVSHLQQLCPEEADEYERLRREVNAVPGDITAGEFREQMLKCRAKASTVPFHAAGDHSPGYLDNTVSHAVSSYTPTVKALEFARERLAQSRRTMAGNMAASASDTAPRKLCVVTMPHTPGLTDLPEVISELLSIQNIATPTFSITSLPSPAATRVKEQLQSCHIFHFAGHGKADGIDPSHAVASFP